MMASADGEVTLRPAYRDGVWYSMVRTDPAAAGPGPGDRPG